MKTMYPVVLAIVIITIGLACATSPSVTLSPTNEPSFAAQGGHRQQPNSVLPEQSNGALPDDQRAKDVSDLVVLEGVLRPMSDSSLWSFPGEVKNNTSSNVFFIKVSFTFYDANGKVVLEDYQYTETYAEPGGTAPYEYLMDDNDLQGKTWASYKVTATGLILAPQREPNFKMTGRVESSQMGDGVLTVTGVVKNIGETFCKSPLAVVIARDSAGKVVTVFRVTLLDQSNNFLDNLPPSEEKSFTAYIVNNAQMVTDVEVRGSCENH